MILFHDDKLSSIAATYDSPGYTSSNLLDSDPKHKWEAGVSDATLLITPATGATGAKYIALFGITGAVNADVTFRDSALAVLGTSTLAVGYPLNQLALEITNPATTRCDIRLYDGGNVGAAILRVSTGFITDTPEYGFSLSYVSYGIRHAYKTGGYYLLNRGQARKYSGSLTLTYPQYVSLMGVMGAFDAEPMAIIISEDMQRDSLFGSMMVDNAPGLNYQYPLHGKISISIQEFV